MPHRATASSIAALIVLTLASCGGSSSGTSSTTNAGFSPVQYETAKSVAAYIPALNQIMAPTRRPPANPRDIAHAHRVIATQISQLERLTPPASFATVQRDLLSALKGELAIEPQLEAAIHSNEPIALSNAQAKVNQASGRVSAALAAIITALNACKASTPSNFRC
jgi:hypothetical protein